MPDQPCLLSLAALFLFSSSCSSNSTPGSQQAGTLSFHDAIYLETTSETSANASLGDLDGDGDFDIVLAKGRHWPLLDIVLLNDGNGSFIERHNTGDSADRTYTAALADLDGDSDLDLVLGNDRPDPKLVYHNDGTGHFEIIGTFGDATWPTRNVTVVDLTGDGYPDIVAANRGGSARGTANYICPNDGEGYFSTCRELSSQSATTIGAGDLTGDGHIDLVVPHRDGGQSFIYVNDGNGDFETSFPLGPTESATRAIALGDINGNGRLDIVVGNDEGGGALVYVNQGNLIFEGPIPLEAPSDLVYSIAIADLDEDGDNDIVLGAVEAQSAVLVNSGDGMSFSVMRFGDSEGAVYGLAIGDVNGDGLPDIVTARSGAPNMLYLNAGSR